MNPPTNSQYRVVEIERTHEQGPGARILFGLASDSSALLSPTPIFCLCFHRSKKWELIIDSHYNPVAIHAVASNGAHMGLGDLVKLAKTYAYTTHPNG
ncbi:MAG: hypothetical protein WCO79_02475 [bacterium]